MSPSDAQHWNPAQYRRNAGFVSELGAPVVELLAPQPGERILDLGCGDGALAIKLVELGCKVVGVDSSAEMIAAAKVPLRSTDRPTIRPAASRGWAAQRHRTDP